MSLDKKGQMSGSSSGNSSSGGSNVGSGGALSRKKLYELNKLKNTLENAKVLVDSLISNKVEI